MDKVAELTKRIDRVHSDIKRNPSMRADFAPYLRELESELTSAVENECGHTAEGGHSCIRENNHHGAHRATGGEWWPYAFEGTHFPHLPPFFEIGG